MVYKKSLLFTVCFKLFQHAYMYLHKHIQYNLSCFPSIWQHIRALPSIAQNHSYCCIILFTLRWTNSNEPCFQTVSKATETLESYPKTYNFLIQSRTIILYQVKNIITSAKTHNLWWKHCYACWEQCRFSECRFPCSEHNNSCHKAVSWYYI